MLLFCQYGNRPFALAAAHGCVRMLQMLMEEPYNMATMEENKVNLLHPSVCRCFFNSQKCMCCSCNNFSAGPGILWFDWQVEDTPLHLAAKNGQCEALQLLLDNFNIRNEVNQVKICSIYVTDPYQHGKCTHTLMWCICGVCRQGRPLCIWLQMELMRTVYKPCWRHSVTQPSSP